MKIAFVMPNTLPMPAVRGGAAETVIQNYIDENELYNHQNVTVYCRYDAEAEQAANQYVHTKFCYIKENSIGIQWKKRVLGVVNLISNYRTGNDYIRKVCRKLKQENFDVIVVENAPYYMPVLDKVNYGRKVLHVHNDYSDKMKKLSLKYSDDVFCVSNYIKEAMEGDRCLNAKVSVLLNCIDVEVFAYRKKDREQLRARYGVKEDETVYLFAGRLIQEKGVLELIKAFQKVAKVREKVRLFILGGVNYSDNSVDSYLAWCRQEAEELKEKIVFTGYVNYERLPEYYSFADIGVIPSLCKEAASLTAIEMLTAGLPIIANKIGGLPEMVKKQGGGCCEFVTIDSHYISNLSDALLNAQKADRMNSSDNLSDFSKKRFKDNFDKKLEVLEVKIENFIHNRPLL